MKGDRYIVFDGDQILEELNVKSIEFIARDASHVSYRIKPNLPRIGKQYGKQIPEIRAALEAADGAEIAGKAERGEDITIVARVQDYLDEIYLENQNVQFGHSGTFFDVSNRSIDGGWIYINVKLNESNSLIQAGDYLLSLIIRRNDYYQSITASHSDPIHIFEISTISFSLGGISMEDMNYVIRPTIKLYDEDGSILRGVEFFIQLIDKKSGEAVYIKTMTSGSVEIALFDSGAYKIVVSLANNDESISSNIHEIATYFYEYFYLFLLAESEEIQVVDNYIVPFIIPLISDALIHALQLSANWDAEMITFIILLVLNVVSGVLGKLIKFTWTTLLKVVLLSIFCALISKLKYFYFGMISKPGIQKGMIMVVGELTGPDWLLSGVGFLLGGIGILAALIGNRPQAAANRARFKGKEIKTKQKPQKLRLQQIVYPSLPTIFYPYKEQ